MGKMLFGTEEKVECIQPVRLKGGQQEALCLAYKTTKTFFIAGLRLRDDGYVLGVVGQGSYYPFPEGGELAQLQASALLPSPLPGYSIPWYEYAFGYSLWLVAGLVLVLERWSSARKKRRVKEDAEAPLSAGPPTLKTEFDHFLADTLRPLLGANERIEQQAYGFPEPWRHNGELVPGKKAAYCALTNERLFFIQARTGAFGPLKENQGIDQVPRAQVSRVINDDGLLHFVLADGTVMVLWVRRAERKFSNQLRFIRDVPKLLATPRDPRP